MSIANSHHRSLAHHFKTLGQQFDAAKLGTWLFLSTEILMFGGLFVGYIIFHNIYLFYIKLTTTTTVVMIGALADKNIISVQQF